MSELSERLREAHPISQQYANGSKILLEAADEITRLQSRVKEMEAEKAELVGALYDIRSLALQYGARPALAAYRKQEGEK